MTSIPVKLTERRAELLRESDGHHASMLALTREIRVTDARLAEIELAIAAIEDADCAVSGEAGAQGRPCTCHPYERPVPCPGKFALSECIAAARSRRKEAEDDFMRRQRPNAEAGERETAPEATLQPPGAESAPAGSVEPRCMQCGFRHPEDCACAPAGVYGGQSLGAAADERLDSRTPALGNVSESPSTNPPPEGGEGVVAKKRAPKRDIRGMVMEYVDRRPQPPTLVELAAGVDMPVSRIEMVVASLQRDQRVILIGGVVKRTKGADGLSGHRDDAPHPWYGPCDALGPAGACVECGKALTAFSGPMMRDALITFLTREPDSTMAEINAAGISAAEVYRAEREGVIILKAHGLYALPEAEGEKEAAEAKQSEAAE